MIGRMAASKEIGRMAGLEYFSTLTDPAMNELVKALCQSANEIVAAIVVNEILSQRRDRPTPADIYSAVSIHNQKQRELQEPQKTAPVYRCAQCQDSGMYGGILAGPEAGPWKCCSCPAGGNPNLFDAIKEANAAREKILQSSFSIQRKFSTQRKIEHTTSQSALEALGYTPREVPQ